MKNINEKTMQENPAEVIEAAAKSPAESPETNASQTQQPKNNASKNPDETIKAETPSPAESSETNASQTQQSENNTSENSAETIKAETPSPAESSETNDSQTQQSENSTSENSEETIKPEEQSPTEVSETNASSEQQSESNTSEQQSQNSASEPQPESSELETLSEVREVKGYRPKDKMISIKDYSGKDSLYLEVKYRKEWFLRWCLQHGHVGVLDDSDIRFNPECRLVEGRATVTVDGIVIGKSAACKPYDPTLGNLSPTVFQDVGTIALGRALANAGFGTVNGFLDDGDTRSTLADAPVAVSAQTANAAPVSDNPMIQMANAAVSQQTAPQKNQQSQNAAPVAGNPMMQMANAAAPQQTPPQQQSQKQPQQNTAQSQQNQRQQNTAQPQSDKPRQKRTRDISSVSSVEEARQAVMPIGASKGKTLGEIYDTKKEAIVYFANRGAKKFDKPGYENLIKACAMILDAEKENNTTKG